MKAKVGMLFFNTFSGVHKVTRIDGEHKGFFHVYNDGKKRVKGFMYDIAFERLTKVNAICVL